MHDNNCEGWARTVSGEFSEEAVRLAGKAKLERAELDALAALQPREAIIPPSVFKRMLDRGKMHVKIDGLIKAAWASGSMVVAGVRSREERPRWLHWGGNESNCLPGKHARRCGATGAVPADVEKSGGVLVRLARLHHGGSVDRKINV